MDEQAFQLVDKQPFRCLLTYLRPGISEKDIPHCNKLRAEIFLRAKEVENRLKDVFKVREAPLLYAVIEIMYLWIVPEPSRQGFLYI